ncbi:hypothetical protein LINPERHAP2_LOCUS41829 [Linum perenne]
MLDEYNVLAKSFRQVRTALQQPTNQSLRLQISEARVPNGREYALPIGTKLVSLIPGDFEPNSEDRDIIVNNCETGLTRITSLNPLFDSLHFPLLFPHGGIRYKKQLFLDAMVICHYFGNSDLFITFTCNAQWPEITNAFNNDVGTHGKDKPQIVAQVFRMKLLHLKKDIDSGKYFGKTVAGQFLSYHVFFMCLANNYAENTKLASVYDYYSELPNPDIDPIGYAAITKFILHGPCGEANPMSPCMVNGKFKNFF